ncbi:hypothetical protein RCC89_11340 [Cytophagaceae bacterium ABcell3]|nr:hypothetical protein RCC89_11340 [Cytophagaceae bacterium ABcell3]
MKKLFLIILLAFLYSCEPRIKNDTETFEKVFSMSEFDIEIQNWGCFGGTADYFTVKKKNNEYILKSKETGKSHLISQAKMDSLKNYLEAKIGKDEYGGCTSSEYIRVGSFFYSVDYHHSFCSGIEATMINNLLNYRKLISKEEKDE